MSISSAEDTIDVERLFLIARRQLFIVGLCGFLGFCLAAVYAFNIQPRFTASTSVILGDPAAMTLDPGFGASVADTLIAGQIELLRSTRIALKVVERVGPETLAETGQPSLLASLRSAVRSLLPGGGGVADSATGTAVNVDPMLAAALALRGSVDIQRVGRSPAIVVAYTSTDPELAARIPNTYAQAYVADLEGAIAERATQAREWLQKQMQGLQQNLYEAEIAVAEFRRDNGLPQAGGQLLSERMIVEINTQIAQAQSDVGLAEARARQIGDILASADLARIPAIPADMLTGDAGEVIRNLRDEYVAAESRLAEVSARAGSDHLEVADVSAELGRLRERLATYLRTLHQQALDNADVARGRFDYLDRQLGVAVERNLADGMTLIDLANLEHSAENYRTLFRTYINQYQQQALQSSAPQVVAQVISPANRPLSPASPRKAAIAIVGLLLGLLAGAAIAVLREYRERYYRTGEQLVADLGTEFFGSLPATPRRFGFTRSSDSNSLFKTNDASVEMWAENLNSDTIETLRRASLSSDLWGGSGTKVIGVISALPGEGKTTFAINFSRLLASSGKKTILIDADFRKPDVAGATTMPPSAGLVELLLGACRLEQVTKVDEKSGLVVIPSVPNFDTPRISQLIASAQMNRLLDTLRETYEYVVLDLPPMSLVADARSLASSVDGFFLVVRWGHTPRRVVENTLIREPLIRAKLFGAVLNRVNMRRIRRYLPFGSAERYRGEYQGYGPPTTKKEA